MLAKNLLNGKNKNIKRTKCPDKQRAMFLPRFIGNSYPEYEQTIYDFYNKVCNDYNGGYWEFYTLSNGGFYMASTQNKIFEVEQPINYYSGKMSADAVSIGVNLYLLSDFAFRIDQEWFSKAFHYLRDYALQHAESGEILRFID